MGVFFENSETKSSKRVTTIQITLIVISLFFLLLGLFTDAGDPALAVGFVLAVVHSLIEVVEGIRHKEGKKYWFNIVFSIVFLIFAYQAIFG
ncbi:hypothetical protein [Jeotgalibacillus aurantiacus]|uniref:hypothetical protein n=1 Tax=Jeotgalibacillus aurantiacus TaxID=2763266 RepID=UPI001D0B951A|nr:hypothetical protein [Jeotgalibacillus aurantiacus]